MNYNESVKLFNRHKIFMNRQQSKTITKHNTREIKKAIKTFCTKFIIYEKNDIPNPEQRAWQNAEGVTNEFFVHEAKKSIYKAVKKIKQLNN